MPFRPGRPCRTPGCSLVGSWPRGRCPEHEHSYDRARGTAPERGYDADHRVWRVAVLTRDPYCVDPDGRHPDEVKLAVQADHVVPITSGGASLDVANGRGLCASCHSAVTAARGGGFGNARR